MKSLITCKTFLSISERVFLDRRVEDYCFRSKQKKFFFFFFCSALSLKAEISAEMIKVDLPLLDLANDLFYGVDFREKK